MKPTTNSSRSNGKYVVGADGQPTLKKVEVGLMGVASAEITSGLNAGEAVVTRAIQ